MSKKKLVGKSTARSGGSAVSRRKVKTRRSESPGKHVKKDVKSENRAPKTSAHKISSTPFVIVGIGASAGGLEALGQLLAALPENPCIALVIVQHMAPQHESLLPNLLAESTKLPVAEVTDGLMIEPNRVYVIPPNREMGISNGRLKLMPRPNNRTQFNPIDFFFHSLAEYAQARAIGVVLSGTASDGAIGLREINAAGGIAISQDPKTAKFDGMPRAAIATGVVDLVLPPTGIAQEISRIGRQLFGLAVHSPAEPADVLSTRESGASEVQFTRICSILRKSCGVDFTHYKQPTIRRRLHRRMVLHKVMEIEQYIKLLEQNPAEVTQLYQDILIHVTRFFRDSESFDALQATVFPELIEVVKNGNPIRVWVPGCSTGEEVYSVAIQLLEFLGGEAPGTPIQVFGTDISEITVEQARAGVYPESISADVSPDRLRRYFSRVDGHYRINKSMRDLCIFARQDVTRDPPFSKLDLIVCRNVLIYFDTMLQKKLMQVFHYALRPRGFLMLGAAETIGPNSELFGIADRKNKVYTKKPSTMARRDVDFLSVDQTHGKSGARPAPVDTIKAAGNAQSEANRILLSRYSPPGVIVDADLKIVQFRGATGHFLEPAPGEASLSLLKMAREGLLYGLRAAVHEARKKEAVVRKEGLRVKIGTQMHDVGLEVIPLAGSQEKHWLILFHDQTQPPKPPAAKPLPAAAKSGRKTSKDGKHQPEDARVVRLQQELAASREYLQSIIQDMEAANEELQSANEEILSSNEELQSTNEELDTAKEELQSTNEELNTVNEELQGRNEELSRVNSDLVNLLGSVQIAIVMVAGDLRIRRFTPMAEKVLNLIPSDVGRPISDIKPNINCPDLERLIVEAIDTITIKECEAQDRLGNWYLLRIRPYKNVENRIDGAVVALFDVDSSRRQTAERAVAPEAVGELTEASNEPTLILDAKQVVRSANKAFVKTMQWGEIVGRSIFEVAQGHLDTAKLKHALDELAVREGWVDDLIPAGQARDGRPDTSIRVRRQLIGGEPMTMVVFDRSAASRS